MGDLSYDRNFYPRSPCGERPLTPARISSRLLISIHALLAESDTSEVSDKVPLAISIHALLAESDRTPFWLRRSACYFYPRSPCGERLSIIELIKCGFVFLSTLSLRRATRLEFCDTAQHTYFYPRSPCGERLMHTLVFANPVLFLSTLSLRRATRRTCHKDENLKFLSTLSLRRATSVVRGISSCTAISIHALLAESDFGASRPKNSRE